MLILFASFLPSVPGHGLMTIPPSWQTMGGKLGVTGGGYANEGGIDRWYTDNTHLSEGHPLSANSPLRTYQDTTLTSLLRWALLSVKFDKIHTRNIYGHVNVSVEAEQVKEMLKGNVQWSVEDTALAQERLALFFPDANPYRFFGLDKQISGEDLQRMMDSDDAALSEPQDVWVARPWRSPGAAHIDSPCGVFGGNFHGCPGVGKNPAFYPFGDCPGGGSSYGPKGETLNFPDLAETAWAPGSEVEVGWSVSANHGGGYSYRLCKLPEGGKPALTEACFQGTPLEFVGNTSWIQYANDTKSRKAFTAVRTTAGTTPTASQWTKNPVPPCQGADGGLSEAAFYDASKHNCVPQFGAPVPGILGFGIHEFPKFVIVDLVKIPEHLPAGKYVLSHRWDCEQTMQVWASCTDINLAIV